MFTCFIYKNYIPLCIFVKFSHMFMQLGTQSHFIIHFYIFFVVVVVSKIFKVKAQGARGSRCWIYTKIFIEETARDLFFSRLLEQTFLKRKGNSKTAVC